MTDPDADAIEELLSAFDSLYKYANDDGRYSRPNRARLVLETWLRDVRPVGLELRVEQWRQWVRLIFTHLTADDIAPMTDRELQRVVCEAADAKLAAAPVPCAASPADRESMLTLTFHAFEKNGIRFGERVVCIDAPNERGTVLRCDARGVDVRWDDGKLGELVWDVAVAYNAYRLQVVRQLRATGEGARDECGPDCTAATGDYHDILRAAHAHSAHQSAPVAVALDPHRLLLEFADNWLAAHEADPRFRHDVYDIEARGLVRELLARLRGEATVRVEE